MERNHKKYRPFVIDNFNKFLNNEISLKTLHDNLHSIQTELGYERQRSLKCVWFKFTKDDTLATTINGMCSDLVYGTKETKESMLERIQLAVNDPKNLSIFYS